MQNILISTECVADVPSELVEKYNIGIIYYTIKTDKGEFRDTDEITAANVMEYIGLGEKKALGIIPSSDDYKIFFKENLEKHDEIIHISISGGVSEAVKHAMQAREELGADQNRVHIIDSRHLSSGLGLLVLEAARLNEEEQSINDIVAHIEALIPKVSTTFLTYNADYLYYNNKVSKRVMDLCNRLYIHPVLGMADGKLTIKGIHIGKYDIAARGYLKKVLRNRAKIRKEVGFITYAGCSHTNLDRIKTVIQEKIGFEKLFEQQASASISCNCGPHTFGILYIKK